MTGPVAASALAVLAAVSALWALLLVRRVQHLHFTQTPVMNLSLPVAFWSSEAPGFRYQRLDSPRLKDFRQKLPLVWRPEEDSLDFSARAMKWVRALQSDHQWMPPYSDHDDPHRLLCQFELGTPGACRRFASFLTSTLVSFELNARLVGVTAGFSEGMGSHCMTEVWISELRKWVLLDPTLDTIFIIDNKPAGLFELFESLRSGRTVRFDRRGSLRMPAPSEAYYQQIMKHIFIATTNAFFDGYGVRPYGKKRLSFIHYCDDNLPRRA
jgi:hypothetical protein